MRDISAAQVLIAAATNYQIVVFAKDQIATVLANMAASPICRTTVASDDGLRVLHDFLLSSPRPDQRPAEISACERVQQKSAIALSRLCSETDVAKKVVHMGVVARLVQLCRDERERNQSDAVLIGCLAALRKLVTACGMDPLKSCNASDLVEPRLLDSFLLCSSQQESYV
ncbi:unnamed protein product [Notodromas monacha]|uniref:Protein inscuteable homologue C-terminal domain-containing protein n=1 Tax=Notodromas monacha TaxID=399045 RepID=A0A7R9GIM3_9CRUS|nr:unnamed protein product [Notodromas monacha]CAG0924116.1 unnamed protein product [Notodromas monacha]